MVTRKFWVAVTLVLGASLAEARVQLFPGVARLGGAINTVWRSDGVLYNPTTATQTVKLELIPRGAATVSVFTTLQLQPAETRTIASVHDLLGATDGAGVLRVTGDVAAWFRSYNQGPKGTFGQDLPPLDPAGGYAAWTVTAFAFASAQSILTDFRSNLLLVNLDTKAITFTITSGGKEKTTTVAAGVNTQINNLGLFLGTPKGFGSANVTADGRWYAVVSTVDPVTGDPTTVRGLPPVAPGERLYPGVAKLNGSNQTAWRTEATFANPGTDPVQLRLGLIPRGSSQEAATRTVTLAGGEALRVADLYGYLNVATGAGMLKVTGAALAWVRTFNQGATGTFGQDLEAVGEGDGVSADDPVLFVFESPADPKTGFRSNLVVLNLEARDITVTMRSADKLGTKVVPAHSYAQVDNLGTVLGTPVGTEPVWISADGRWSATISTIDPFTGDPMTVRGEQAFAPPSSYDLVDQARANRTLSDEQALLYGVYADYKDPRLPVEYRGDDRFLTETDSLDAATSRWASLSKATRDAVGPFLVPPFVSGSWWDLRRATGRGLWAAAPPCRPWEAGCPILADWEYKQGANVRVWYLKDNATSDASVATSLVNEAEGKIWPGLASLMQRWPLPDGESGGSPHLDIALVDGLDVPARTRATIWDACKKTPAYILLSRTTGYLPYLKSLMAHEMMHATQFGYDMAGCMDGYRWLAEPIATWFEDYLYPTVDREHSYADNYLDEPEKPMDAFSSESDRLHAYGAYLFFQYLTRIKGTSPAVIRYIWEATTSGDAFHALDAGLKKAGVPLDESWPAFGVHAWNASQPFAKYMEKDILPLRAAIQDTFPMSVSAQGFFETAKGDEIKLPRLSTRTFAFEFPDDTSAVVGFFNGLNFAVRLQTVEEYGDVFSAQPPGAAPKGAHVKALLKIGGKWKEEDWTGRRFVSFCRLKDSEKLESLVVILSNASIDKSNDLMPQGSFSPLVWTSNFGCGAWEGNANLSYKWGPGVTETMTVGGIGFLNMGDGYYDEGTPLFRSYIPSTGSWSWKISGSGQGCSYSGQAAGPIGLWPGSSLFVHPWVVTGPGNRAFVSGLFYEWTTPVTITETCGSPPKSKQIQYAPGTVFLGTIFDNAWKKVSRDGRTWDVDAGKTGVQGVTGTWHFAVKRTP